MKTKPIIVNILKDGTTASDMSKVTVPAEVVQRVSEITKGSAK